MTDLHTLPAICKRAGVSPQTAHKYLRDEPGRIPVVGTGRRRRYPAAAVEVLAAMRVEGEARRGRPRKDGSPPVATAARVDAVRAQLTALGGDDQPAGTAG